VLRFPSQIIRSLVLDRYVAMFFKGLAPLVRSWRSAVTVIGAWCEYRCRCRKHLHNVHVVNKLCATDEVGIDVVGINPMHLP